MLLSHSSLRRFTISYNVLSRTSKLDRHAALAFAFTSSMSWSYRFNALLRDSYTS